MVAELQLPEASELAGTHGVELDFSLGCQGRLDAGVRCKYYTIRGPTLVLISQHGLQFPCENTNQRGCTWLPVSDAQSLSRRGLLCKVHLTTKVVTDYLRCRASEGRCNTCSSCLTLDLRSLQIVQSGITWSSSLPAASRRVL